MNGHRPNRPAIVFISNCDPPHYYIINSIAQRWNVKCVIRPVWARRKPAPLYKRLKTLLTTPVAAVSGHIARYYYKNLVRIFRTTTRAGLEMDKLPALPCPLMEIPAADINSAKTARMLQELAPDLLLVAGAPILKEEIFTIPTLAALNMHYGIAPDYRGEHTLFWPLRRGDFSKIGVTLHYMSSKVDAGPLLARAYPAIEPEDTEATLWVKCAKTGAEMLSSFLTALEPFPAQKPAGLPQSATLPSIRQRDRKLRHDLAYVVARRIGLHRLPALPARVEKFY